MPNDELLSNNDVLDLTLDRGWDVVTDNTVNTQLFKDPDARILWLNAQRAINELDNYLMENLENDVVDEGNS